MQVKAGKHAWALGKYRRIIALLDTRYSEIEDDLNAKVCSSQGRKPNVK